MSNSSYHLIILAAGNGTRMKSSLPKVLHPVAHLPLIGHVLTAVQNIKFNRCIAVIPPDASEIQHYLEDKFPTVTIAVQDQAKGTGHAVQCALSYLPPTGKCVILFADTPFIRKETIQNIFNKLTENHGAVVVAMNLNDPNRYGRVVLNDKTTVQSIVEYNDASEDEKLIKLCNAGIMGFNLELLHHHLPYLTASPHTHEFYLTDLIAKLNQHNQSCQLMMVNQLEAAGVNTRVDLSQIEHLYQQIKRQDMMTAGVTLINPLSVYFSYDTDIESDVTIEPHVFFGPGVTIKSGAVIKSFSYLEGAKISNNVVIGPFARIRPDTIIEDNAKIGNFVEIKKSLVGQYTKINHLSYIGDTTVGCASNIGAGTITCNYDGIRKSQTVIGNNVMIGSNTALIAPLTIGDDTLIGAGSVITRNVQSGDLALSRPEQKNIQQGSLRFKQRVTQFKGK